MSEEMNKQCLIIRDFLFKNVYNHQSLLIRRKRAEKIILQLFNYFKLNQDKLPKDWIKQNQEIERVICDYISGMTDRFASRLYSSIYE